MKTVKKNRPGFAMTLVLIFILLFLTLLAVSWRRLAAAVRVETAHVNQIQRDQGSIQALGLALALLETGTPPADPYVCGVSVATSQGTISYTVTFASEGTNYLSAQQLPSPLQNFWSLTVEEQSYLVYPTFFLALAAVRKRNFLRTRLAVGLGLAIIGSFALSVVQTSSNRLLSMTLSALGSGTSVPAPAGP